MLKQPLLVFVISSLVLVLVFVVLITCWDFREKTFGIWLLCSQQ